MTSRATVTDPRDADHRSLWWDALPARDARRAPLRGRVDADIAVVGAGFTGLWTAYYLARTAPELRVVVLERDCVGYGASGRNGGWVSDGIAGSVSGYQARPEAAAAMEAATREAVDEVGDVAVAEGIECGYLKRGSLVVATNEPQWRRLQALHAVDRHGVGRQLLSTEETVAVAQVSSAAGALYNANAARVDPARLAQGLARACERRGVVIYEDTEIRSIAPHRVSSGAGDVRAGHVAVATESYTTQLPGEHRRYLPLYSLMIATEPLPEATWDALGWDDGLLIGDAGHLFFYAQRTPDGRLAIGGRGAPYRLRSPISPLNEADPAVRARLGAAIAKVFPAAAGARITHAWGGSLAVPRDWCMSVEYDPNTGIGRAGGYVGHGLAISNVAGRTLADLITGQASPLTRLPWVGHRSRRWEPEPLRYLASRTIVSLLGRADRHEERTGRPARSVVALKPFLPRP